MKQHDDDELVVIDCNRTDNGDDGEDNEKYGDSDDEGNNDVDDDGSKDEDENEVNEIKIQLIIKNKTEVSTAKILVIQPANYCNVKEKINLTVRKILEKKVKSSDYTLSYKVLNACGPSNVLEDELDFEEFINEYKKINLSGKKMSIIVTVRALISQ